EFVEIHLKERLAKRRAAIDIALRAAADRTSVGDLVAAPISSRSANGHGSDGSLPSSSNSHSHGMTPGAVESSQISQLTGPQLPRPPARRLPPVPVAGLRWLWALAVGVGALGVVMIIVVATRKPESKRDTPAAPPSSAMALVPPSSIPSAEPPPPLPDTST